MLVPAACVQSFKAALAVKCWRGLPARTALKQPWQLNAGATLLRGNFGF